MDATNGIAIAVREYRPRVETDPDDEDADLLVEDADLFVEYDPLPPFEAKVEALAQDGDRVGSLWVHELHGEDGAAYIHSVGVLAPYRNRGIGATMLRAAEDFVRAKGYGRVTLDVYPGNAPAVALYTKVGFAPAEPGRYPMRMEKRLS